MDKQSSDPNSEPPFESSPVDANSPVSDSNQPKGFFARKTYETKSEKKKDFWIGVGLWFGLNIVMLLCGWGAMAALSSLTSTMANDTMWTVISTFTSILGFVPFIINIGVMIYFARTRSQIALGMLAGFGISLLLVVCLGVIFMTYCFVAMGSYN
jgi:hypothetical protein